MLRDARTRRHLRTITIEATPAEIETELSNERAPVLDDIVRRLQRIDRKRRLDNLAASTDFFDSIGNDTTREAFYTNEVQDFKYG